MLVFLFEQFRSAHLSFFLCFCAALVLIGILLNAFPSKNSSENAGKGIRYRNWLLIAGIGWIGMPALQWISALFFLLAFLESQARYPLEIGFSNDRVVINTLFKKKIDWPAFNNIVLKDGLLTLDFKNDHLFQKDVLDDGEEDADEDEFNEFCQKQLLQARKG
jgi:hypothetical protein